MVSGVHDSDSKPLNLPMFTGELQKQPKESRADAFATAATAKAKAFLQSNLKVKGQPHGILFASLQERK